MFYNILDRHKRLQLGFTLIELMIVLVIGAILATIAYNVYTSYVRRAQRSNARAQLLQTAQKEERYYTAHGIYSNAKSINHKYKHWKISKKPIQKSQTYTLTATKKYGGISDQKCGNGNMQLKSTGKKLPPNKCWPSR